jgi:hypothetical protein
MEHVEAQEHIAPHSREEDRQEDSERIVGCALGSHKDCLAELVHRIDAGTCPGQEKVGGDARGVPALP